MLMVLKILKGLETEFFMS